MLLAPEFMFDLMNHVVYVFVFPKPQDGPPLFSKPMVSVLVPLDVERDLGAPVLSVCLWRNEVLRAAVPETPVDVYGDFQLGERDVDCPPPVGLERAVGDTKPPAATMKFPPHEHLWLGIARAVRLHGQAGLHRAGPG